MEPRTWHESAVTNRKQEEVVWHTNRRKHTNISRQTVTIRLFLNTCPILDNQVLSLVFIHLQKHFRCYNRKLKTRGWVSDLLLFDLWLRLWVPVFSVGPSVFIIILTFVFGSASWIAAVSWSLRGSRWSLRSEWKIWWESYWYRSLRRSLPPPPPPPPPPVPPPAPPLPALLGCWWLAISAILLSICSKRSKIDILNWLSRQTAGHRGTRQHTRSIQRAKKKSVFAFTSTNNPVSWQDKWSHGMQHELQQICCSEQH